MRLPFERDYARRLVRSIPALLVASRFVLGPALFLSAARGRTGAWFLLGIVAAFLSDVYDGILARRLGVATERLRVADSWTDAVFYFWIATSAWMAHPAVIRRFLLPLMVVLGIQFSSWAIDLVKYHRIATFHTYTAKAWGATLFAATLALFFLDDARVFLWLALVFGIISNIEGIAIKLLLPSWKHDVPSFWQALRLRRAEGAVNRSRS